MNRLSLTLLVLATLAVSSLLDRPPIPAEQRTVLVRCIALAGLVFYPAALGLGPWDPYRLGYGPWPPCALFLACAACVYARQHFAALAIALALAAHATGMLESTKAWDYLLDPVLWLCCLYAAARDARPSIRRRPAEASPQPV